MPNDTSNSPETNPFHTDQAELEYLSLVDDLVEDIDDQFIANINQKIEPESQEFSPITKPVLPQRFMLWAIACATIPSCIVVGFAYQINQRSIQEANYQTQEIRAIALADSLNNFVLRAYEDTKELSRELALTSGIQGNKKLSDRQKNLITNRLNSYIKDSKAINNIGVYSLQGNLISQSDLGKLPKKIDKVLLQRVITFNSAITNQTFLEKPNEKNSKYVIQFIVPISDLRTKKIQAIVKSEMSIKSINSNFTVGNYAITDANKTVLRSTFKSLPSSLQFANIDSNNKVQLLTVPTRSLRGLPDLKWYVSVGLEPSTNYNYALILGVCILVLIVAIALITYIAARQFSHRLIQAANAINAIIEGSPEKRLAVDGNDEIDQLSSNINLMNSRFQSRLESEKRTVERLQRLIAKGVAALQKVIQTNREDSNSADIEAIAAHIQSLLVKKQTEINLLNREQERLFQQISHREAEVNNLKWQNSEQANQMISQIEKSTDELKNSSDQYKIILQEIVDQAEQKQEELVQKNLFIADLELALSQLVTKMSTLTKRVAEVVINPPESYEIDRRNTELMTKQIMDLREAIAISSKKAKRLSEYSQKISKVVDLIHEIGIEANFLAVNAGIKANREHSNDFRIFSDQVEKLGNMAIATMKEMEQLATNIQTETRAVMGNLETGATQISEATKLIAGVQGDLQNAEEVIKRQAESESKLYASLSLISKFDQ